VTVARPSHAASAGWRSPRMWPAWRQSSASALTHAHILRSVPSSLRDTSQPISDKRPYNSPASWPKPREDPGVRSRQQALQPKVEGTRAAYRRSALGTIGRRKRRRKGRSGAGSGGRRSPNAPRGRSVRKQRSSSRPSASSNAGSASFLRCAPQTMTRTAAVAGSPVFGVPLGSMSNSSVSSCAMG
jgi:hypothetical protein